MAQLASAPAWGAGGRWFESTHPDEKVSYFVYILQSEKDRRFYIGSSADVNRRLEYHNTGKQRSTKNRTPFKLVYKEELKTKSEALKREKQIKDFKGGEAFKKLLE